MINILKLAHTAKGNYVLQSWDKPKMMLLRKLKIKDGQSWIGKCYKKDWIIMLTTDKVEGEKVLKGTVYNIKDHNIQ